ncbi:DUF6343 family protein [Streptosporangium soli]|nr:DUF6343 family protein [Streptosporangium sp. KLBMP 9127]
MRNDRTGTEPANARSPLRTRAVLSGVVLPLAVLAVVYFVLKAVRTGEAVWTAEAVIAGAVALVAAVDLAVIRRRLRGR